MCLSRVLTNWSGPLFIWHPSEVGMSLNHMQTISTQWITYFKTTWDHGCLFCCISSLHFCLRLSNTSFSHSFMNSFFMYISQQVSNPRGPSTALQYSLMSRHPSTSAVPLNCFFNCASLPPSLLSCISQKLHQCYPPMPPLDLPLVTPLCSPPPNIWHRCFNSVQMPSHSEQRRSSVLKELYLL